MGDISRCCGKAQVKKMAKGGSVKARPKAKKMAVGGQVQMAPQGPPMPMRPPGPMIPQAPMAGPPQGVVMNQAPMNPGMRKAFRKGGKVKGGC